MRLSKILLFILIISLLTACNENADEISSISDLEVELDSKLATIKAKDNQIKDLENKIQELTSDNNDDIINQLEDELIKIEEDLNKSLKDNKNLEEKIASLEANENSDSFSDKNFRFLNYRIDTLRSELKLDKEVFDYQNDLMSLDYKNLDSVKTAVEIYKSYANDDKAFNDYLYQVFYDYIFAMRDYHFDDAIHESRVDSPVKYEYVENGFTFLDNEGIASLEVNNSFMYTTFSEYLSEGQNDLNYILSFEQEQSDGTYFIMDMALWVTWEDIAERIRLREDYYQKYKGTEFDEDASIVRSINDTFLRIYTGELVIDNTPPYDYSNKSIDDDLLDSYLYFISEYSDSEYHDIIEKVYLKFKDDNFRYDENSLDDFYRDLFGSRFWDEKN